MNILTLKIKRWILVCCVKCIWCGMILAQNDSTYFQLPNNKKEEKKKDFSWAERISVGGSFAFFASSRYTFIDLSPLIGYRLSKLFLIGAGPVYNYYSEYAYNTRYTFNMYGFRIMARMYFIQNLFFQTGWDNLNRSIYVIRNNTLQQDRIWIQNIWVGGGVRYSVGANSYMFTSVLFNLNQTNYSPYPNPYIQIGFISGF